MFKVFPAIKQESPVSIEERLTKLEESNRRMKRLMKLLGVMAVCGLALGAADVSQFLVHDGYAVADANAAEGHTTKGVFSHNASGGFINLYGEDGHHMVLDAYGIHFIDSAGNHRVFLGVIDPATIALLKKQGIDVSEAERNGKLEFRDAAGERIVK